MADLGQTAAALFDRFAAAFAVFDAEKVADLFAAPGVALRSDGTLVPLTSREDVVRYYRNALESYRDKGCTSSSWEALETVPMGEGAMLATVTWRLLRADGSQFTSWRQSYSLALGTDGPRIFASASHRP